MEKIELRGEIIRLGQLLKLSGLVDNGGEAKVRIQAGEVRVNGQIETRRGRQLQEGDLVEYAGRKVEVCYLAGDSPAGQKS
ncbi:MAG TPA: RNA-binding S4 domain-containing protein [Desulfurivibrionaceae bacterium]|nr:RNA-binding S4 domain-containing protein [Desulfurivibrionaceae bacterium]